MTDLLFSANGKRKYLTAAEQARLIAVLADTPPLMASLCRTVTLTGMRISEALSLTPANIDFENGTIVTRCLKKRREHIYRTIPVPYDFLAELARSHAIEPAKAGSDTRKLWLITRMTAYRWICNAMDKAGISGPQASPKGLRHGFGVAAIHSGVPLNMVQRWLGHADIRTTAIYTYAVGPEERALASRMWTPSPSSGNAMPSIERSWTLDPPVLQPAPAAPISACFTSRPG